MLVNSQSHVVIRYQPLATVNPFMAVEISFTAKDLSTLRTPASLRRTARSMGCATRGRGSLTVTLDMMAVRMIPRALVSWKDYE